MPILISGEQRAAPSGAALVSAPALLVTVGAGVPGVSTAATVAVVATTSTLTAGVPTVNGSGGSVFGGNFGGDF